MYNLIIAMFYQKKNATVVSPFIQNHKGDAITPERDREKRSNYIYKTRV